MEHRATSSVPSLPDVDIPSAITPKEQPPTGRQNATKGTGGEKMRKRRDGKPAGALVVGAPESFTHALHVDPGMSWSGTAEDHFKLMRKLGDGAFGDVYLVKHFASNELMAVKELAPKCVEEQEEIQREIEVLRSCRHANIVSLYGTCATKQGKLWIIMEYLDVGSMRDLIEVCEKPIDNEAQVRIIVWQVLKGLAYLHDEGIIHRDVKGSNILFGLSSIKIADFGVAGLLEDDERETVGTCFWMAPEVVLRREYGPTCDVWSLGITTIEAAHGLPPHSDESPVRAMHMIPNRAAPTLPRLSPDGTPWSDDMADFVKQCLNKDGTQRATSAQLLQHPWFTSVSVKDVSLLRTRLFETMKRRQARKPMYIAVGHGSDDEGPKPDTSPCGTGAHTKWALGHVSPRVMQDAPPHVSSGPASREDHAAPTDRAPHHQALSVSPRSVGRVLGNHRGRNAHLVGNASEGATGGAVKKATIGQRMHGASAEHAMDSVFNGASHPMRKQHEPQVEYMATRSPASTFVDKSTRPHVDGEPVASGEASPEQDVAEAFRRYSIRLSSSPRKGAGAVASLASNPEHLRRFVQWIVAEAVSPLHERLEQETRARLELESQVQHLQRVVSVMRRVSLISLKSTSTLAGDESIDDLVSELAMDLATAKSPSSRALGGGRAPSSPWLQQTDESGPIAQSPLLPSKGGDDAGASVGIGDEAKVEVTAPKVMKRVHALRDASPAPCTAAVSSVDDALTDVSRAVLADATAWLAATQMVNDDAPAEPMLDVKVPHLAEEDYTVGEALAEGSFGSVFRGTYDGKAVAVKRLQRSLLEREETLLRCMEREIQAMRLHHPNIIHMYGTCDTEEHVDFVMELAGGGSLADLILDHSRAWPWPVRLHMMRDVASAMEYVHKWGFMHRDLKSDNVLLTADGCVKLSDFGLSRPMVTDGSATTTESAVHLYTEAQLTICGSRDWMAPEVLMMRSYTPMVDVFSFGVVLVEALTRADPPERDRRFEVDWEALSASLSPEAPLPLLALSKRCCATMADQRPTFAVIHALLCQMVASGVALGEHIPRVEGVPDHAPTSGEQGEDGHASGYRSDGAAAMSGTNAPLNVAQQHDRLRALRGTSAAERRRLSTCTEMVLLLTPTPDSSRKPSLVATSVSAQEGEGASKE